MIHKPMAGNGKGTFFDRLVHRVHNTLDENSLKLTNHRGSVDSLWGFTDCTGE